MDDTPPAGSLQISHVTQWTVHITTKVKIYNLYI